MFTKVPRGSREKSVCHIFRNNVYASASPDAALCKSSVHGNKPLESYRHPFITLSLLTVSQNGACVGVNEKQWLMYWSAAAIEYRFVVSLLAGPRKPGMKRRVIESKTCQLRLFVSSASSVGPGPSEAGNRASVESHSSF